MPLPDRSQIHAILLDIEGTTTPIEFVSRVLFPYAHRKFGDFLRRASNDPDTHACVEALKQQHSADEKAGLAPPPWPHDSVTEGATAYGRWLISRDVKFPALKTLQGKIWQEGYNTGELRGEVYPDVPIAFERWKQAGKRLYIYSSGSVLAQKLLFGSTQHGDLTPMLDGFFDTSVGPKTETGSYREIANHIAIAPAHILFLSDSTKELEAAVSVGIRASLLVRDPHKQSQSPEFDTVNSFNSIFPDSSRV